MSNQSPVTIILVNPNQQLNLYPAQLPPAIVTKAYEQVLIVTGGYPPYTWSAQGTSNAGLTLATSLNMGKNKLMGTGKNSSIPNTVQLGTYPITITVTDSQNNTATITQNYSLTVNGESPHF